MKLTLQTDFALRTMIYAAFKQERIKISEVAQFFDISKAHVAKVVNLLSRHGYIRSIRGPGGGLELAKPPDQISIGEIVRCVEGSTHMLECMSINDVCTIQHFCSLQEILFEAERVQEDYLLSKTIADVVPGKADMKKRSS
ncbi:MAG: transcriptional regulator, Rrf2 [Planctomycetaceae bacterium]|nr:transcriptional regulator, Rrf2 [Planctomycetaceae bacterium]